MIYVEEWLHFDHPASPEKILWLAVIERAILDYIFPTIDLSVKHRNSLQWFFFTEESEPHNLNYICNVIFEYPDAANTIRRRLLLLKNQPELQGSFIRGRVYKG